MRVFLIANGPYAVGVILLIEALVLFGLIRRQNRSKSPMILCMVLVTAGLLYDGAVILLGRLLPETILKLLSMGRFLFHGLCMPLLLMISVYALEWEKKTVKVFWIIAGLLMAAGAAAGLLTRLDIADFAGLVRCTASDSTPKWADSYLTVLSVAMVIPLLISGIILLFRKKGPFLLLSGLFMFAFSALGPATGNTDLIFLIGMFGEALMVLFFLLHAIRAQKA
jgi:hypothetical protein